MTMSPLHLVVNWPFSTFRARRSLGKMCIGHGLLCVYVSDCLSLATFPHYCMDPDVTWGMVGVPSSCALLGGLAVRAWVSLLCQHIAEHEMSASACTHSIPGYV